MSPILRHNKLARISLVFFQASLELLSNSLALLCTIIMDSSLHYSQILDNSEKLGRMNTLAYLVSASVTEKKFYIIGRTLLVHLNQCDLKIFSVAFIFVFITVLILCIDQIPNLCWPILETS